MNVFLWNARARNGHVEATLNHPFPAQVLGTHGAWYAAWYVPAGVVPVLDYSEAGVARRTVGDPLLLVRGYSQHLGFGKFNNQLLH